MRKSMEELQKMVSDKPERTPAQKAADIKNAERLRAMNEEKASETQRSAPAPQEGDVVDTAIPAAVLESVSLESASAAEYAPPLPAETISAEELFAMLPEDERDRLIQLGVEQALAAMTEDAEAEDAQPQAYVEYDGKTNDYVVKYVEVGEEPEAARAKMPRPGDPFALGPEYHEGVNALFDYRWMNQDERANLADRTNGFVPVKNALDTRFREQGGAVRFGDLILGRRPKSLTEERAYEQATLHARLTAAQESYMESARGIDGVETLGTVSDSEGPYPVDTPSNLERSLHSARGRKSFQINAPFQKERLNVMQPPPAKRDRPNVASVGGS